MIQFIHLYMQLGCLACEEIIHVSDQPVAPSVGTKPSLGGLIATGTFLPLSAKYWYCQVVPTQSFPLPYDWICCAAPPQYSPTSGRCCLSSCTAALNCLESSSYGSAIPSLELWALR